eukprot:s425_g24.t1
MSVHEEAVVIGRALISHRRRLSQEVVCPALLFALVCLADLVAVVAPLDSAMSAAVSGDASASHLTPEDSGFAAASRVGHKSRGRSASAALLVVSIQAVLRASLLVTFRLAQRRRNTRVLP